MILLFQCARARSSGIERLQRQLDGVVAAQEKVPDAHEAACTSSAMVARSSINKLATVENASCA